MSLNMHMNGIFFIVIWIGPEFKWIFYALRILSIKFYACQAEQSSFRRCLNAPEQR